MVLYECKHLRTKLSLAGCAANRSRALEMTEVSPQWLKNCIVCQDWQSVSSIQQEVKMETHKRSCLLCGKPEVYSKMLCKSCYKQQWHQAKKLKLKERGAKVVETKNMEQEELKDKPVTTQETNKNQEVQKRIYLACPYTNADGKVQEERFKLATLAARQLIAQGKIVFSPLTHGHTICGAKADELPGDFKFWQVNCLSYLNFWATDIYILMVAGWENSVGVQAELALAQEKGLPVTKVLPLSF